MSIDDLSAAQQDELMHKASIQGFWIFLTFGLAHLWLKPIQITSDGAKPCPTKQ